MAHGTITQDLRKSSFFINLHGYPQSPKTTGGVAPGSARLGQAECITCPTVFGVSKVELAVVRLPERVDLAGSY
jgi:hypothetical protein